MKSHALSLEVSEAYFYFLFLKKEKEKEKEKNSGSPIFLTIWDEVYVCINELG